MKINHFKNKDFLPAIKELFKELNVTPLHNSALCLNLTYKFTGLKKIKLVC